MTRCCCGKIRFDDDHTPIIFNGIMHEVFGPYGNFCGPVYKHELDNAFKENSRLTTQFDLLVESHNRTVAELQERLQETQRSLDREVEWRRQADERILAAKKDSNEWMNKAMMELERFQRCCRENERLTAALREIQDHRLYIPETDAYIEIKRIAKQVLAGQKEDV